MIIISRLFIHIPPAFLQHLNCMIIFHWYQQKLLNWKPDNSLKNSLVSWRKSLVSRKVGFLCYRQRNQHSISMMKELKSSNDGDFYFFSIAMLSQLLILAFLWLISVCTGSMISLFLPSSSIKFISRLTNNKISRTVYLLCNKKCKYPNIWRRVSSFENLRMCQYPSNNSIQSSSWTMIPLSWFPNFHILWVWTQEADLSYPCVRCRADRVILFVCPGLYLNESHFAHVKVTKIFLVPRQAVAAAYYDSSRL